MSEAPTSAERRHDLDWLRAFAILALLFFHAAMPFVAEWDWHIRNAETSNLLLELNFFISRFRMALLFVIAGIASHFVLRRRSSGAFLRDRAQRLIVPLLVGILVIVPPQVYFERLADGDVALGFLSFWPSTFELRPYPAGNTSYHHLWFLFYLFLYSLLLLPVMAWARRAPGARALARFRARLAQHGASWLALPIVAVYAMLAHRFSGTQNLVDDGAMFLVYLMYFAVGFVIADDTGVWDRIVARRRQHLTAAVTCVLLINGIRWNGLSPHGHEASAYAWRALLAVNAWVWVLTILGYGRAWLNRENAVLRWTRDASYPFYILHQTVIVVLAYYVVQTQESILAKYLFLSFGSLLVTMALYETMVRPHRVIRWLFGMTPEPRAVTPAVSAMASAAATASDERRANGVPAT